MNRYYTSIEQSKHLLSLGMNPDTADMMYGYNAPYEYSDRKFDGGYDEIPYQKEFFIKNSDVENEYESELPCWSVGALLDTLPMYSTLDHEVKGWWCSINLDILDQRKDNIIQGNSAFEAAYNMVVWLLENDYKNDLRLS